MSKIDGFLSQFLDPIKIIDRSRNCALISIVGPKYPIPNDKLSIAVHRSFVMGDLQSFLIECRKKNVIRSYLPIKMCGPLVLTRDPANLDNEKYQNAVLTRVFSEMQDDSEALPPDTLSGIHKESFVSSSETNKMCKKSYGDVTPCTDEPPSIFEISEYAKLKEQKFQDKTNEDDEVTIKDKDDWLRGDKSSSKESEKKVKQVKFTLPLKYKTGEEFALMQFISILSNGKKLDEPIIVVRGFFKTMDEVKYYKETYLSVMSKKHPNNFITYLDLVVIPIDRLIDPWYSRDNVKHLKFRNDKGLGKAKNRNMKEVDAAIDASNEYKSKLDNVISNAPLEVITSESPSTSSVLDPLKKLAAKSIPSEMKSCSDVKKPVEDSVLLESLERGIEQEIPDDLLDAMNGNQLSLMKID